MPAARAMFRPEIAMICDRPASRERFGRFVADGAPVVGYHRRREGAGIARQHRADAGANPAAQIFEGKAGTLIDA